MAGYGVVLRAWHGAVTLIFMKGGGTLGCNDADVKSNRIP